MDCSAKETTRRAAQWGGSRPCSSGGGASLMLQLHLGGGALARRMLGAAAAALLASAVAVLLASTVGGCGAAGLRPSGAGLAPGDSAGLSVVVAQTRAQFPRLSAPNIPYSSQDLPAEPPAPPTLVLEGEGVSVQPGAQLAKGGQAKVSVFLSKPGYDQGFVKLAFGAPGEDKGVENWRIVAFEKRGRADDAFEFVYVLSAPGRSVRYLVVIGGRFREGTREFGALEGTLVFPDDKTGIEGWRRALKVNFGRRFPIEPVFRAQVAEADALFVRMKREVPALIAQQERIRKNEAELATLRNAAEDASMAPAQRASIEKRAARLTEQKAKQAADIERVERDFTAYYRLREEIASAYAVFTETNRYRWAGAGRQHDFFDAWKVVEFHHKDRAIDDLTAAFSTLLADPTELRSARAAAMEAVKQHDNWSRNPALAG